MFTSVIGALTSLLPKYFIFGSYVPVLIFSFVNLGMVYLFSAWSRFEIEFWLGKSAALSIAVAFVATVVMAYVVSAINDYLREFLEGKHLPGWLETELCAEQKRRRMVRADRYAKARRQRFILEDLIDWCERQLRHATERPVMRRPAPVRRQTDYVAKLRELVMNGALHNTLHNALSTGQFKKNRRVVRRATAQMARRIALHGMPLPANVESDRRDFLLRMGAVLNSMKSVEYELGADLFTRFGNDPVKPTRMGNIADAIHAYTIGRYKMELTVFFSRLQTLLARTEDKGNSLVFDAKTQLDFLVACCWFSALTTVIWSALLASFSGDLVAYIILPIVGTATTVALYFLACEAYLAYGEVVRASIDIDRFTLLRKLAVGLPNSLREERKLWGTMSHLAFSGGDSIELSYDHSETP